MPSQWIYEASPHKDLYPACLRFYARNFTPVYTQAMQLDGSKSTLLGGCTARLHLPTYVHMQWNCVDIHPRITPYLYEFPRGVFRPRCLQVHLFKKQNYVDPQPYNPGLNTPNIWFTESFVLDVLMFFYFQPSLTHPSLCYLSNPGIYSIVFSIAYHVSTSHESER